MTKWIALAITILLTVFANALLRYAARSTDAMPNVESQVSVVRAMLNPYTMTALAAYGTSFLVYSYALRVIDVSVAYPIIASGSLLLIAVVALVLFKEPFPPTKILGTICVCIGVVFLSRG